MEFITLNPDNVMSEHLCCAISDKKHQTGVMISGTGCPNV